MRRARFTWSHSSRRKGFRKGKGRRQGGNPTASRRLQTCEHTSGNGNIWNDTYALELVLSLAFVLSTLEPRQTRQWAAHTASVSHMTLTRSRLPWHTLARIIGSRKWITSCRASTSIVEHPLAMPTTNKRYPSPHTMIRARRRRKNRACIHSRRHQRLPKPCLGDGKSELSLLSCRVCLFIQLYSSIPSTAHMQQQ